MMNDSFARRIRVPRTPCTSFKVELAGKDATFEASQTVQAQVSVWTTTSLESWGTRNFLLAPLRVDIIIGLPLFRWFNQLTFRMVQERM
ncbi:hypothetical protein HDU86_002707, partial [Geranomyces michiganensis]